MSRNLKPIYTPDTFSPFGFQIPRYIGVVPISKTTINFRKNFLQA